MSFTTKKEFKKEKERTKLEVVAYLILTRSIMLGSLSEKLNMHVQELVMGTNGGTIRVP